MEMAGRGWALTPSAATSAATRTAAVRASIGTKNSRRRFATRGSDCNMRCVATRLETRRRLGYAPHPWSSCRHVWQDIEYERFRTVPKKRCSWDGATRIGIKRMSFRLLATSSMVVVGLLVAPALAQDQPAPKPTTPPKAAQGAKPAAGAQGAP